MKTIITVLSIFNWNTDLPIGKCYEHIFPIDSDFPVMTLVSVKITMQIRAHDCLDSTS